MAGVSDPATTYTNYLKIEELLDLQQPRSDEHDEMLFVVIHQVYELWFKQILWEFDHAVGLLDADDVVRAGHTLNRVLRILKVLVSQLDVLETMTPLEFLSFRDRLESASGFQSAQFRQLEQRLGLVDGDGPELWPALLRLLGRRGHAKDAGAADGAEVGDDSVRAMLVDVYRTDAPAAELCERYVDLDEGVQEWRYRHLKMVQRTIGTRGGTGGSDGAEYLATTIRPAFPALWAIRTEL